MADYVTWDSGGDRIDWDSGGDNILWNGVATTIILSGPSSAAVGIASTNFTVGANGDHPGFNYTPTSDAGTGSFTPSTIAVAANSTGTFTYTATSAGARNINGTNDGGYIAAANVAFTAVVPALAVSAPATGGLSATESGNFTFTLTNAGAGTTTVTPSNGLAGTWNPTSLSFNASGSQTAKYTPSAQGPTNPIGATGNNGTTAATTVNFPIYSSLTANTAQSSISNATLAAAGVRHGGDGNIDFELISGSDYRVWMAGLDPSDPLNIQQMRQQGTLANPYAGGAATLARQDLPITDTTFEYAAGGHYIELPGMTKKAFIIHCEQWLNPPGFNDFWSELRLFTTTDNGDNYVDLGTIIRPKVLPQYGTTLSSDVGGGAWAPLNGYIYIYFTDQVDTGANHYNNTGLKIVAVARCPQADFISAVNAGTTPVFTKYYNGSFSESGIEGNSSSLIPITSEGPFKFFGAAGYHTETNSVVIVNANTVANASQASRIQVYQTYDGVTLSTPQTVFSGTVNISAQVIYASMTSTNASGDHRITNPVYVYYPYYATGYGLGTAGEPTLESRQLTFDTVGAYALSSQQAPRTMYYNRMRIAA